jgi:hypothetical protein
MRHPTVNTGLVGEIRLVAIHFKRRRHDLKHLTRDAGSNDPLVNHCAPLPPMDLMCSPPILTISTACLSASILMFGFAQFLRLIQQYTPSFTALLCQHETAWTLANLADTYPHWRIRTIKADMSLGQRVAFLACSRQKVFKVSLLRRNVVGWGTLL